MGRGQTKRQVGPKRRVGRRALCRRRCFRRSSSLPFFLANLLSHPLSPKHTQKQNKTKRTPQNKTKQTTTKGWAFDGEGRLRDVPSAEEGRWPKRPLVGSYPVKEQGGFVWLFYGDLPEDLRPPLPASFVPELEREGWHAAYGEMEFDCGHWGVFENAIDFSHIHYLHGDSFGNSSQPKIHGMETSRPSPYHVESKLRIHNKPPGKMWEWTATPGSSVPVTAKAMLPSTSAVTIELAHGVSMITFVNTVPISETKCVNRFCLIRNFAGWEGFDDYARRSMLKILGEDKAMVELLRPEALDAEYSLGPDAAQVAFRRLRQEWVDLGYGSREGLSRSPRPARVDDADAPLDM